MFVLLHPLFKRNFEQKNGCRGFRGSRFRCFGFNCFFLLRQFCRGGIEQQLALTKDEDVVEQRLHVVHLMRGDDDGALVVHVLSHHLPELRF